MDTASVMKIEVVSRGSATGEETEGMEEEDERMDTMTLELVDQMEIEISEMEETGEEEGVGDNQIEEKMKVIKIKLSEEPVSLNLFTLTISFFLRKPLVAVDTLPLQVDFPPISLSCQLTDNTIVELTQLLHVCCGLKVKTLNMFTYNMIPVYM